VSQGDALAGCALENYAGIGYTLNMKLSVTIDRDEDGIWVAECPSIPGCVSQGKTKPQALKNIKEAIALCLEVRAERGLPLTVETQQVEVLV
jgi:predicted RNase H-like HicB family nuclease